MSPCPTKPTCKCHVLHIRCTTLHKLLTHTHTHTHTHTRTHTHTHAHARTRTRTCTHTHTHTHTHVLHIRCTTLHKLLVSLHAASSSFKGLKSFESLFSVEMAVLDGSSQPLTSSTCIQRFVLHLLATIIVH